MALPWSRLRVRINSCGSVRCEAGWRLDEPWSQRLRDFDLWFIWAGRGSLRTREGVHDLRPGVCFWMRPGGLYLGEQDLSSRLGVHYLHFDLLDAAGRPRCSTAGLPGEHHEISQVNYADSLLRRVIALWPRDATGSANVQRRRRDREDALTAETLLKALLMDLSASGGRRGRTGPAPRQATIEALAAEIRQSPVDAPNVGEMARRLHCSPEHFSRLFRQVIGLTPHAFVVQARIDRARQLLLESSLTVSEIADALGYRDVFFFSRQFSRKTGRSPSAYRQRPD